MAVSVDAMATYGDWFHTYAYMQVYMCIYICMCIQMEYIEYMERRGGTLNAWNPA